jgi:ABC-type Mn2+/Zn2+ transport system permease subunit
MCRQSEDVDWSFPVLVEDVGSDGPLRPHELASHHPAEDREAVDARLERVGMSAYRKRQIGELSGGQKKRVFLARALAQDGRVILLDEPFTGVDVTPRKAITDLLRTLRDEGRVMLVSTHNLGSVPEFCDRTVLLDRTVLASGPTEEVFTQANLERTFGGVLRHFVLGEAALEPGRRRAIGVLTDDERPFIVYEPDAAAAQDTPPGPDLTSALLEPFGYGYMISAMTVSALVGGVCAFLSAYLMLKGWSLIGDALSHAVVPGVAGAYMLGLPFSIGAFLSGGLAAGAMLFLNQRTKLKEDAIIGLIFTAFFGLGLFMVSVSPTAVDIQTIVLGNILAITPGDTLQLVVISAVSLIVLLAKWKDLLVVFFDENHARSVGLNPTRLKVLFFTLLSACTVAALQTVGRCW